jgi:hypothetical protein
MKAATPPRWGHLAPCRRADRRAIRPATLRLHPRAGGATRRGAGRCGRLSSSPTGVRAPPARADREGAVQHAFMPVDPLRSRLAAWTLRRDTRGRKGLSPIRCLATCPSISPVSRMRRAMWTPAGTSRSSRRSNERLASFARLAQFGRVGNGASDRTLVHGVEELEDCMEGLRVVLDTVGFERPARTGGGGDRSDGDAPRGPT